MIKKYVIGCLAAGLMSVMGFQASAETPKVTVFGAASLSNALEEIGKQYESQTSVKIVTSFASSSTLARQIEQGAPADLFISADQQWMDYLADKKMLKEGARVTLLNNDLVLIAPKSSKLEKVVIDEKTPWVSLLEGGKLAVGDPDHVPVGIYAKQAFEKLGSWNSIESHLARTSNVRAALTLVEREEAPIGIVYSSDVVASDKVKIIAPFPAQTHKPIEYPMALLAGERDKNAQDFYHYLQGPDAAAIFKKFGFKTEK